ncbi:MAG: squalene/phytoene synthase family protein [Pirellulales bacterium]|nr:squalene/phytoene synthase family protein [Pirellulales bacterium]
MTDTPRPTTLEGSYRFCREAARRSGSNFAPCFRLLPSAQRRAMDALYAFTRHADDLGDNPQPAAARREALDRWRAAFADALAGRFAETSPDDARRLLPALADAVERFSIPPEHLRAVIDGVCMDLEPRLYETFDELAEYCHRVASSVGLACVRIWGYAGPEPIEAARRCGLAFQLTNILRDVAEDTRLGRVYLPQEDLRRAGYSVEQLQRGEMNEAFVRLVEIESARTEACYRQGAAVFDCLSPCGRRVFGMMFDVYYRLFQTLRRSPERLLRERIAMGRWAKLRIAARWLLLPARRPTPPAP